MYHPISVMRIGPRINIDLDIWHRVVHQLLDDGAGHVLHDDAVDGGGDDGDGDHVSARLDDAPDLLVADADHVLAVHLQQVVVDQQPVPGGRGVHGYGHDLALLKLEPDVASGILKLLFFSISVLHIQGW